MKKTFHKFLLVAFPMAGILLTTPAAHAQTNSDVLKAGQKDVSTMIKAYVAPGGIAVGHALNGGWFTSGKAMGLGRFEVRAFATVVFTQEDQTNFDISKLDLETITLSPGESPIAPTIFGKEEEGPQMEIQTSAAGEKVTFRTPPGIGLRNVPVPMAQASLGLIKDTEVAVRFIPETEYDDYSVKLWGVGVKHGLKQWIPVISAIPGFDIAAFGGYTQAETTAGFEVAPDPTASRSTQQQQAGYYEDQHLVFTTKAWTASLVVSKTVSVITAYGGMKYSHVTTDVHVNGPIPLTSFRATPPNKYIQDVINPVALNVQDSQFGLTAGVRLKLLFFSLYGEGTLAKYPSATAGVGFGFN